MVDEMREQFVNDLLNRRSEELIPDLDALIAAVQAEGAQERDASEAEDKQVINCGGMSATFTFDEALAEVQRLGLRCEELYPNEAEVGRLYSRNVKLQATVQAQAEEIAKGLDFEHHTSCGHIWTMRATACPECFAVLKADHARLRAALTVIANTDHAYCGGGCECGDHAVAYARAALKETP